MNKKDITGQKFGKLTALKPVGLNKHNQVLWLCQCECGNTTTVITSNLLKGKTKSCGCFAIETRKFLHKKHGLCHTRLNAIYRKMKGRCYCKTNPRYSSYGGRGITVCDEWLTDFMNFYNWAIQNGYTDELTIERIDNNGNYEPSNCKWATYKEQGRNTRHCHYVDYKGQKKALSEWCEILNLNYPKILQRLNKLKWTPKKAFETL